MSRQLRSARMLVEHRSAEPAPWPAYWPGGPVVGTAPVPWAELNVQPRQRFVGRAAVVVPTPAQLRELRRRAMVWRLQMAGWAALTALVVWAALRWVGPGGLGCPAMMLGALVVLRWCAAADVRAVRAEMLNGR